MSESPGKRFWSQLKQRKDIFVRLLELGRVDSCSLDLDKCEEVVKLLDAGKADCMVGLGNQVTGSITVLLPTWGEVAFMLYHCVGVFACNTCGCDFFLVI